MRQFYAGAWHRRAGAQWVVCRQKAIGGTSAGDWRLMDGDGSQHRETRTSVGRVVERGTAILRMSVSGKFGKVVGVAVKRPMQCSEVGRLKRDGSLVAMTGSMENDNPWSNPKD